MEADTLPPSQHCCYFEKRIVLVAYGLDPTFVRTDIGSSLLALLQIGILNEMGHLGSHTVLS